MNFSLNSQGKKNLHNKKIAFFDKKENEKKN